MLKDKLFIDCPCCGLNKHNYNELIEKANRVDELEEEVDRTDKEYFDMLDFYSGGIGINITGKSRGWVLEKIKELRRLAKAGEAFEHAMNSEHYDFGVSVESGEMHVEVLDGSIYRYVNLVEWYRNEVSNE